jgi:hypothetical protein
MSQYNPKCTRSFDLHMILHSHFYYSVPFGVPFYIRLSKRNIDNCFLLFQMHLPYGQLNTDLSEVKMYLYKGCFLKFGVEEGIELSIVNPHTG